MAKKKAKKAKKKTSKSLSDITAEKQIKKRGRPKGCKAPRSAWKPGQSGNPQGRPKGTKERDYMLEAKLAVEKAEKKSIYQYAFERAFKDDRVLIAMLKKLVPDMAYIDSDAARSLADIFALVMGESNGNGKS